MTILAIDPGTACGWAVLNDDDSIQSGTWKLGPRAGEVDGVRPWRLLQRLAQVNADGTLERVIFEDVKRHTGTTAAHVYGELTGIIKAFCVSHDIPYEKAPVGQIKKHATGKGNASKALMVAAALGRYPDQNVRDDNQADALWLLDFSTGGRNADLDRVMESIQACDVTISEDFTANSTQDKGLDF